MLDKLYIYTCGSPFLTIIEILKAGLVKKGGLYSSLSVAGAGGLKVQAAESSGSQVWHLSRAPYFGAHCSAGAVAEMPVSGSPYIARRENRNEVGVTSRPPHQAQPFKPTCFN